MPGRDNEVTRNSCGNPARGALQEHTHHELLNDRRLSPMRSSTPLMGTLPMTNQETHGLRNQQDLHRHTVDPLAAWGDLLQKLHGRTQCRPVPPRSRWTRSPHEGVLHSKTVVWSTWVSWSGSAGTKRTPLMVAMRRAASNETTRVGATCATICATICGTTVKNMMGFTSRAGAMGHWLHIPGICTSDPAFAHVGHGSCTSGWNNARRKIAGHDQLVHLDHNLLCGTFWMSLVRLAGAEELERVSLWWYALHVTRGMPLVSENRDLCSKASVADHLTSRHLDVAWGSDIRLHCAEEVRQEWGHSGLARLDTVECRLERPTT